MSMTASVAAVLVLLFRWIFGRKLPKRFHYALWAIVLVRLLIPVSLPSMFSIFNAIPTPDALVTKSERPQDQLKEHPIPNHQDDGHILQENTKNGGLKVDAGSAFPSDSVALEASIDPMQDFLFVASWAWLFGTVGVCLFSMVAFLRTSRQLREAVRYEHQELIAKSSQKLKIKRKIQIFTSDKIDTPVVFGFVKPRIILPLALTKGCNELELKHMVTHELVHIKRYDYLLKPLSMLVMCVHWFNPVIWMSFICAQKDMEMSCDERVMSSFDHDIRRAYATSLIKLAAKQNKLLLNGGLLAFGESNIKSRIKGIMKFKKPKIWVGTMAMIALIAMSLLLLTNGQSKTDRSDDTNKAMVDSEQIKGFAQEIMKLNITNYESNPEVKIKDSKITRLEWIHHFDALGDTPIDVYALEYRLLPEDLSKVVLAGGMDTDGGWLKETCSMGSPLLVISKKSDLIEHVGTLWTGSVQEEGGLELSIKELQKRKNIDRLLAIIMSSPLVSSNTGDYIKSHQKEYDEIISMGDKALPYLRGILEGGDQGLRGNIVGQLCEDIKKGSNSKGEGSGVGFDKSKVQEYWLETVVIRDCQVKEGPGDDYNNVGDLKYGAIVQTSGKYNDWIRCIKNNGEEEFWVHAANLVYEEQHRAYHTGIITAKEVVVGTVTLKRGNLVQVLKRDQWETCVTIRVIDVNVGKTGWIKNSDYTLPKPGVFFNQGYVRPGTVLYKEPSLTASTIECSEALEGTLFVNIDKEQDDWVFISSVGPISGWTLKENISLPTPFIDNDGESAHQVVRQYFDAFSKADYMTMRTLATDSHNKNLMHDGDVWGMKWAKASEIKFSGNQEVITNRQKQEMVFFVSVDMETAITSAQYPSTQTSFSIILVKGDDGIWRVDRYTTG
jgi:beta-lactamase regulating signal transducer with metallopeptidase domain